ncbi:hypothetical protein UlMin_020017 [Ulmus minor]
MHCFLCSLDDEVWYSILEGYKIPAEETEGVSIQKQCRKWSIKEKRDSNMNSKALNAIFCRVDDLNFRYIQNCKIAKEAWDKLEVAHEGTEGVKRSKLQMLTSQFESIRMEEGEKVADFNAKLIDITNRSCVLGEEYIESKIVRKILRSLPHRFQGKVIAIEESKNVDKIRLEELIGSLETFEIGLAFKSGKKSENNEAIKDIDDEELVFFTRKFKQFLNKNRDCANNKGKSMKVTWSDDSDEETKEEETEEESIQAFTPKLEEFEQESIEENENYEESLEHSYQELFDQGLELIKEKKRLKGKIETLEISNKNLIDLAGNLKKGNHKLSSDVIKLQQKLDEAYKELKETQHAVSVLTLGAEKVTKMINFGKINKSDWYFDNGCTKHMTGDNRNFYSFDDFGTGTIVYGNGEVSNILGVGQFDITVLSSMDKVCYVDKLPVNLISISQLCDSEYKVLFDEYYCNIYDSKRKIVGQGYRTTGGLYCAKIVKFDMCTNDSLSDIDESGDENELEKRNILYTGQACLYCVQQFARLEKKEKKAECLGFIS